MSSQSVGSSESLRRCEGQEQGVEVRDAGCAPFRQGGSVSTLGRTGWGVCHTGQGHAQLMQCLCCCAQVRVFKTNLDGVVLITRYMRLTMACLIAIRRAVRP